MGYQGQLHIVSEMNVLDIRHVGFSVQTTLMLCVLSRHAEVAHHCIALSVLANVCQIISN